MYLFYCYSPKNRKYSNAPVDVEKDIIRVPALNESTYWNFLGYPHRTNLTSIADQDSQNLGPDPGFKPQKTDSYDKNIKKKYEGHPSSPRSISKFQIHEPK
jgi:hypothetical protein